jgi:hypothetical protein
VKHLDIKVGILTVGPSCFGFRWKDNGPYLYPFNYLGGANRHVGHKKEYRDGCVHSFGFWFFEVVWGL